MLMAFFCSSHAYKFYVGGKEGWVLKPSENYNHWAERNRFRVNDTLIFKYEKGADSVLIVNKDDYYKCNKEKPIQALNDGVSEFEFNFSGPFFFISGHADKCEKGQKLIVIVMALRNITHKAPSPVAKTPMPSPSPSPPVVTPPSPSPVAKTPSPSPEVGTLPLSPSPVAKAPNPESPSGAPAPAPSAAPGFGGSVRLVLGLSVVLGTIVGLF
ncbi:hypothetical protein F0562_008437 [Nyssa sinensis]|uniref:Phytocyanin domain-containing protein n=1 Tax=Nyssa sinensis TaxID=561372 RepID=A0A5J5A7B0_9ASTE|nr:hypothetical protein F0562_008437 [Nyssa sinensis]